MASADQIPYLKFPDIKVYQWSKRVKTWDSMIFFLINFITLENIVMSMDELCEIIFLQEIKEDFWTKH